MNEQIFGIGIITFLLLVVSGCEETLSNQNPESERISVTDCKVSTSGNKLNYAVYQDRGGQHCEGIISKEVSSSSIDVVSVTAGIDYPPPTHPTPPHFRLNFYLKELSEVNVVAQDFSGKDYLMDKVRPQTASWSNNKFNNHQWSTKVIDYLNIKMNNLGIVVWLGKPNYSGDEEQSVAPVFFYYSDEPSEYKYQFIFRIDKELAQLNYQIFQEDGGKTILSKPLQNWQNSHHYQGEWDASQITKSGYYKVIITGEVNGNDVQRTIRFYHKQV